MSEYFVGTPASPERDPYEPAMVGMEDEASGGVGDRGAGETGGFTPPACGREQVRFGVPFNDVVPIWHEGADITWHRPLDGTRLDAVLGLGDVESVPGPSPVPPGWSELVEVGTLEYPDVLAALDGAESEATTAQGPILILRAAAPSGKRATNDPAAGVRIALSEPLSIQEAMGQTASDFDITSFSTHIGRLMLRAARDGAILLVTLRAPRDPEAHHLLSVPSEVDQEGIMHFHLGTLLDVQAPSWGQAHHADGMSLLDLDVPYAALLVDAADPEGAIDVERLIDMAQPVVDAILQPGFPFALGSSFIAPSRP